MSNDERLERFHDLAEQAFDCLPEELWSRIDNLEITVDDTTDQTEVLGLYEGIPLTGRASDYFGILPDRITLFATAIEKAAEEDRLSLYEVIRTTLLHEIAHHFGIDDDRLDELGWG